MAKLEVFVKNIESHLINTKISFHETKDDNFEKPSDPKTNDLARDMKHNRGGSDTNRYDKETSPGHSANSLQGNSFPFEEKLPRRQKWNRHGEDQMDDFVYWDTIGGHVDDQARVSTDRRPEVTDHNHPSSLCQLLSLSHLELILDNTRL